MIEVAFWSDTDTRYCFQALNRAIPARKGKKKAKNNMSNANFFFKEIDSPVGKLKLVASDTALVGLFWEKEDLSHFRFEPARTSSESEHPILSRAETQLKEYFGGKRKSFDLPLAPTGTPFQGKVWKALRQIPFGTTKSYLEIAQAIGSPKACRAVGAANGRNPISIIIPCHRVIGADGKLTGFGGGLDVKEKLLSLEKATP